MNYFAHGHRFLDDPYFLAGTAVPDWLNVVDRKVRARRRAAQNWTGDADPRIASLARGIIQHHDDDDWFHVQPAFRELSEQFTGLVNTVVPPNDGLRPGFLGHILVELLLDAVLIAEDHARLDAYYAAMSTVDPELVAAAVGRISGRDAGGLAQFIPIFSRVRFLSDYGEDAKLTVRLDQVMFRVGLAPLPADFSRILPEARRQVSARRPELLPLTTGQFENR